MQATHLAVWLLASIESCIACSLHPVSRSTCTCHWPGRFIVVVDTLIQKSTYPVDATRLNSLAYVLPFHSICARYPTFSCNEKSQCSSSIMSCHPPNWLYGHPMLIKCFLSGQVCFICSRYTSTKTLVIQQPCFMIQLPPDAPKKHRRKRLDMSAVQQTTAIWTTNFHAARMLKCCCDM